MSVRPSFARLAPAPGAPPPRRWPVIDPRRANDSADEMIRSLIIDMQELKMELRHASDDIKLLNELRARDHLAREATFTGRFVATGGAFTDETKSVYEVRVGVLNDAHLVYLATPGHLADDRDAEYATELVTVRFTEPALLKTMNYDGEMVFRWRDEDFYTSDYIEHAGHEYEIKRAARSYMLKHTGWQSMFPFGKKSDSVAPYALF